jgi:hypothetical protein
LQIAHESPLLLKVKSLLLDILFRRIFPVFAGEISISGSSTAPASALGFFEFCFFHLKRG